MENIFAKQLLEVALKEIGELVKPIDSAADTIEENIPEACFSLDLEYIEQARDIAKGLLVRLNEYLAEQETGYKKMLEEVEAHHKTYNKETPFDPIEYDMMFWDIKRMPMYRVERLEKLIEVLNTILT